MFHHIAEEVLLTPSGEHSSGEDRVLQPVGGTDQTGLMAPFSFLLDSRPFGFQGEKGVTFIFPVQFLSLTGQMIPIPLLLAKNQRPLRIKAEHRGKEF